jgi:hypothetical protein
MNIRPHKNGFLKKPKNIFATMGPLWFAHDMKILKLCRWPNIEVFTPTIETYMLLAHHLYRLQKANIEQSIWDKVSCYWEHVEEHKRNLGSTLETWIKHIGDPKNSPKKSNLPHLYIYI